MMRKTEKSVNLIIRVSCWLSNNYSVFENSQKKCQKKVHFYL